MEKWINFVGDWLYIYVGLEFLIRYYWYIIYNVYVNGIMVNYYWYMCIEFM